MTFVKIIIARHTLHQHGRENNISGGLALPFFNCSHPQNEINTVFEVDELLKLLFFHLQVTIEFVSAHPFFY